MSDQYFCRPSWDPYTRPGEWDHRLIEAGFCPRCGEDLTTVDETLGLVVICTKCGFAAKRVNETE